MIAYGSRVASCTSAALLDSIRARLSGVDLAAPGLDRHVALVSLLLSAGELAQGLADRAFEERGYDGGDPAADLAMILAVTLARQVWRSHRTGYTQEARLAEARAAVWRLARLTRNDRVNIRSAEGFQHYGVYPETFAAAAAALGGHAPTLVVGIRTIGTTLAAAVAGVFSRRKAPLTVRPVGHPFDRQLALGAEATRALALARRGVAVVDEGPGLSGSSFGVGAGRPGRGGRARELGAYFSVASDARRPCQPADADPLGAPAPPLGSVRGRARGRRANWAGRLDRRPDGAADFSAGGHRRWSLARSSLCRALPLAAGLAHARAAEVSLAGRRPPLPGPFRRAGRRRRGLSCPGPPARGGGLFAAGPGPATRVSGAALDGGGASALGGSKSHPPSRAPGPGRRLPHVSGPQLPGGCQSGRPAARAAGDDQRERRRGAGSGESATAGAVRSLARRSGARRAACRG